MRFLNLLEDGKENPSAHTVKQSGISQSWRVRLLSEVPEITGELLLFGSQLDVYRCSGDYMLRFPSNHHLALCTLSFDGKEAVFYYDGSTQQEAVDELFYGFRAAFFILRHCTVNMHCTQLPTIIKKRHGCIRHHQVREKRPMLNCGKSFMLYRY